MSCLVFVTEEPRATRSTWAGTSHLMQEVGWGCLAGYRLHFCQQLNTLFITLLSLMSSHFGLALALLVTSVTA